MTDTHVAILAAGQGTRMKSRLPKVLHPLAGQPMIAYVLRAAAALAPATTTVIAGHQGDQVRAALAAAGRQFVTQVPQRGTAHALQQVESVLGGQTGTLVLLSGDVPLLTSHTLTRLRALHTAAGAAATVVTAVVDQPTGYGRIVRAPGAAGQPGAPGQPGPIVRIVEERDATPAERAIREINSGLYAFDLAPLWDALRTIAPQNAQGECYLTDLIGIYGRQGRPVASLCLDTADETRGINSRGDLAEVSRIVRAQINAALMAAGVTLIDPATTYIDTDVVVGPDTVIHPGVTLEGPTTIGAGCTIHSGVRISGTGLGDGVTVLNGCVLVGAQVADGATLGPYAHLRAETMVGAGARVGNFVELKKTTLGPGAKANHLSYLGDATIGAHVNVGAGTITCNYDGVRKAPTIIEDDAFIGSGSQLIAPVRIGRGAYVAAGSSITADVPAGALGVARGRQTNVAGWAARKPTPRAAAAGPTAELPTTVPPTTVPPTTDTP